MGLVQGRTMSVTKLANLQDTGVLLPADILRRFLRAWVSAIPEDQKRQCADATAAIKQIAHRRTYDLLPLEVRLTRQRHHL
jgi:hypothetical protein